MSNRWYPIYQLGNPQRRVYLPNFWMKLMKPTQQLPQNVVHFTVSREMTEFDVKNYLQKLYNVTVVNVKVEMKTGEVKKDAGRIVKEDDYKVAFVTLDRNEKFAFPKIEIDNDFDVLREVGSKLKQPKPEDTTKTKDKTKTEDTSKTDPYRPAWFM